MKTAARLIYISFVLMFVLIGIVLVFAVALGALIMTIMATVKVANGELDYQYPFALRLIK